MADWFKSLDDIHISQNLEGLRSEGNLVYEYNPFKVFRKEDGEITDLDTNLLEFDTSHPLIMDIQTSYDGSANLIINDNKNPPRLINSRFIPMGLNTYKIADREGDQDSNIYNESSFESDISLYKKVKSIVNIDFLGITQQGNLKVGNYVFYFKGCDDDGNESDFIGESGIVTCYKGNLNDPKTIDGGIEDEISYKSANFYLSNIDTSYTYISVYYTRSTSSLDKVENTLAKKVDKKFPIYNGECRITISGYDNEISSSLDEINATYTYVNTCKSQAITQNRLFFGNFTENVKNYKIFQDMALRMLPYAIYENPGEISGEAYGTHYGNCLYYDPNNIYYKLGYWDEELYRFGIVFIQNDYSLSPVFNIRGINELPTKNQVLQVYTDFKFNKDNSNELEYIQINKYTNKLSDTENSAGVVRFVYNPEEDDKCPIPLISLGLQIDSKVIEELKKISKGFFIVRQKRIPTILCQALVIGYDKVSYLPMIKIQTPYGNKYLMETFISQDAEENKTLRRLTHNYKDRIYVYQRNLDDVGRTSTALCPEYELRQEYFNNIFTGGEFVLTLPSFRPYNQGLINNFNNDNGGRHYYFQSNNGNCYVYNDSPNTYTAYIVGVPDGTKYLSTKNKIFSARAGEAEEAWRVSEIEYENTESSWQATNLVRGMYGSFLGIETTSTKNPLQETSIVNIRIPGYNSDLLDEYFDIRFQDQSQYYAVTDRISWESDKIKTSKDTYNVENIYRGDCYICQFTHRMIRNFQDPEVPICDDIVDENCWADNYQGIHPNTDQDKLDNNKINRSDVNAVKLGHWVTFTVRSNINLSVRSTDGSYTDEAGMTGISRRFYPLGNMFASGNEKIPESQLYNSGISSTTSDKYNFIMPNIPAFKQNYQNRIIYSNITVNDSFRNGFRLFQLGDRQDFPSSYGSIIKLVEMYGALLCVCEHGVMLIPINERTVAGNGDGGEAYINTNKVLPENPKVLSDSFGSQWPDSIIKTQNGNYSVVYGIDTVAKKIWKTDGRQFNVISDFKIQEFLNNNINLGEQDTTPTIGLRDVKTHYNAFKKDVMFTFYNGIQTDKEMAWNICYNEILDKWITYYSWIPSHSANIDNIYFSFNRDTSKVVSSNYQNIRINTDGLDSRINDYIQGNTEDIHLGNLQVIDKYDSIGFEIMNGSQQQFKLQNQIELIWTLPKYDNIQDRVKYINNTQCTNVTIKARLEIQGCTKYITNTIYIPLYNINEITYEVQSRINIPTSFWKHGYAGLMNEVSEIKPTYWYGKQHPFEFEVIVADKPTVHKIFENLQLISNKVSPESFHYEVTGDVYDFYSDLKNAYFRQEATKYLYNINGFKIVYDDYIFKDITLKQNNKSTLFPLYYSRVDTVNSIEDYYQQMRSSGKDYQMLSGSEVVYNKPMNEFNISCHVKGNDFDKVGRLRGNMNYQESKWLIQIPSIIYWQKNEESWNYPPITTQLNPVPEDTNPLEITSNEQLGKLRNLGYNITGTGFDVEEWNKRKETKIRDKYIRIKIRFTGDQRVLIYALNTIYSISYA